MAPAFGLVETQALLPHFMDAVTKALELRSHLILETDQDPRLDGRQVGLHHCERQVRAFSRYRCEHVVRKVYSRCVRLGPSYPSAGLHQPVSQP